MLGEERGRGGVWVSQTKQLDRLLAFTATSRHVMITISGAVSCNVEPSPTAPSLVYWLKPKHTLCISVLNSV